MAISLPDARQLSDEVLEALRLRAIRACELGLNEADIAFVLGVTRETVSRWFSAYCSGGKAALPGDRTGRPLGSGRSLSEEQAKHIRYLLDTHSPEQLGIAAPVWSRRAVRDLIRKEFAIDLAERTVGEYLKRWGYTAKKPTRHSRQQDPLEVAEWLEEVYPEIQAQAKQEDADIHFCDETGIAGDKQPRCGYAHKGERASMEVPKAHLHCNVVCTLTAEGELHFLSYTSTMTATLFIAFLERLLQETTRKVILSTDRLRAHDSAEVYRWLASREDRIEVFFLPSYAPELNPVEYLNNDLKGNVHAAGLPKNKDELHEHIDTFLNRLRNLPDRVMRYFCHPFVQYAALVS